MKLPELKDATKYKGLYVIDFGESCSVGFTSDEVAELLESEKFSDVKVYKIHNAYPDGKIELKAVTSETFSFEMGMFFYANNQDQANSDFKGLVNLAIKQAPPARAKLNLAKLADDRYVTAMIFPAEANDEISKWLIDGNFKTNGPVQGGIDIVNQYYQEKPEILETHQLFSASSIESRTGDQLLVATKMAVQR